MKNDSLSFKVYSELRRKILSNHLVSGVRLKEDYWATHLNVNRMAVREALNRLLGENLVVFGEKGGFFVKSLTPEDVKEIREVREIIELGALRLIFQKQDKKDILMLEEICDDFTTMFKREYFEGACEADVRFHEKMIELSGNEKLMQIYQLSNIPLFHQKLGHTQVHMSDYEHTDEEHREIVSALKNKDLDKAEEKLKKHLLRGEMASLDL
ncbi:GntR family transcriptional regulator [Cyclobacterium qasimii]|uniref:Transcriptional regulator, GntR family n=2 Tax=Cyclobacterium qasimii TaxID=1350429 RepID=S7WV30_9BACT|nr:GntR family transcriptional regulator [Cyclobacterium qasimii]EPR67943.1 Transcriptional regulator, GntR family [Cyclobacterium qasimii M12-11B]GEO23038.1 GntR family transcriptional regulator [Cyclobacterium qasimii]